MDCSTGRPTRARRETRLRPALQWPVVAAYKSRHFHGRRISARPVSARPVRQTNDPDRGLFGPKRQTPPRPQAAEIPQSHGRAMPPGKGGRCRGQVIALADHRHGAAPFAAWTGQAPAPPGASAVARGGSTVRIDSSSPAAPMANRTYPGLTACPPPRCAPTSSLADA